MADGELSKNEICVVLGIERSELDELITLGIPMRNDRFDLLLVVPWYVKVLKETSAIKGKMIGRKELAELLGYKNEKYINELESTYNLPKESYNQYDIKKVLAWFISYKNSMYEKQLEQLKGETPQDLLARRSAELKALQIKEKSAGLVVKDLVRDLWLDEINVIVANMDGFCAATAPMLKGIEDVSKVNEILEDAMNELKKRIMSSSILMERIN